MKICPYSLSTHVFRKPEAEMAKRKRENDETPNVTPKKLCPNTSPTLIIHSTLPSPPKALPLPCNDVSIDKRDKYYVYLKDILLHNKVRLVR